MAKKLENGDETKTTIVEDTAKVDPELTKVEFTSEKTANGNGIANGTGNGTAVEPAAESAETETETEATEAKKVEESEPLTEKEQE